MSGTISVSAHYLSRIMADRQFSIKGLINAPCLEKYFFLGREKFFPGQAGNFLCPGRV
jgi:hypothetical protein